ncbi:hypothetical protein FN846DRAFT_916659 [Sphaerosporella brunnea]|uniref:Uncharacterized protein n=1 Tax=Sphaerosporella brunnea TaxID=1250544 RepID=A0A5J5F6S4_9PEZI|nr:hypothetical protein FN846DRAFT_916659 [Sphaerosporella brunnea]
MPAEEVSEIPQVHGFKANILPFRELGALWGSNHKEIINKWQAMGTDERLEAIDQCRGSVLPTSNVEMSEIFLWLVPELYAALEEDDEALDSMQYHATTSIHKQHREHVAYVRSIVRLGCLWKGIPGNTMYRFEEENSWGTLYVTDPSTIPDRQEILAEDSTHYEILPEDIGWFVMQRSMRVLTFFCALAERILCYPVKGPGTIFEAMLDALKMVDTIRQTTPLGVYSGLRQISATQYASASEHVHFMFKEPHYLSMVLQQYVNSNACMVPDENGKTVLLDLGSYPITRIVLQAFIDAYEAQGNWHSLMFLMASVGENCSKDSVLLQELWCMCWKELQRACRKFKRFLQTDHKSGKFFLRRGNRVQLKVPLETIGKKNEYMALLITVARKQSMRKQIQEASIKLVNLEEESPKYRETISDHVSIALADITVIARFMSQLQSILPMPETYTDTFKKASENCLVALKMSLFGLDLTDYVFPIKKLQDPKMTQECARTLDERLVMNKIHSESNTHIFHEALRRALTQTLERTKDEEFKATHARPYPIDRPTPDNVFVMTDQNALPDGSTNQQEQTKLPLEVPPAVPPKIPLDVLPNAVSEAPLIVAGKERLKELKLQASQEGKEVEVERTRTLIENGIVTDLVNSTETVNISGNDCYNRKGIGDNTAAGSDAQSNVRTATEETEIEQILTSPTTESPVRSGINLDKSEAIRRFIEYIEELMEKHELKPATESSLLKEDVEKIILPPNAMKNCKKLFNMSGSSGIPFESFDTIMKTAGFRAEKFGTALRYTRGPERGMIIHRPSSSDKFEGFSAVKLKLQLEGRLGWSASSFVAAKSVGKK